MDKHFLNENVHHRRKRVIIVTRGDIEVRRPLTGNNLRSQPPKQSFLPTSWTDIAGTGND